MTRLAQKVERALESCIPTNWLDPLLTGPTAVLGCAPYTNRDIERLLLAVKARHETVLARLKEE